MLSITKPSSSILYQIISTSFCVIVIISNIISAKMVQLTYFGDFYIPAGLITYPLTFLLSDLVTEVFGAAKARQMVFVTLGMNVLSFGILQLALYLPAQSLEESRAFHAVLGLSGLRIFSSLIAYIVSQIVDIQVYGIIKKWTGLKFLWMRSNGSTLFSQLVDTILIDVLFLCWGMGIPFIKIIPVICFSFAYKAFFSTMLIPIFYLFVFAVKRRINKEVSI